MIPIVFMVLRGVLPPWGDDLVDAAEEVADDWERLAAAARTGWKAGDEQHVADIVTEAAEHIPRPAGYQEGDPQVLGAAAAVLARWIASAPRKKRRRRSKLTAS